MVRGDKTKEMSMKSTLNVSVRESIKVEIDREWGMLKGKEKFVIELSECLVILHTLLEFMEIPETFDDESYVTVTFH